MHEIDIVLGSHQNCSFRPLATAGQTDAGVVLMPH